MKNDNSLTSRQLETIRHIRNWVAHEGRSPSVRELMVALGYKSPRSAQDVLEELEARGIIEKRGKGNYRLLWNPELGPIHAQTINVPIVGVVAAGSPILAEESIEGFIPVSTTLAKTGGQYFLLHVSGDSMSEVHIKDGDLVLVRQQSVAEEGENVVALIDDEATIKEYHRGKGIVILKPRSTNKQHKPIILTEDFQVQGVVVATIPKFME